MLLLSVGAVESRFDRTAVSRADARGLYQIWPATGRLLARSLGWEYTDEMLFDPARNTEMAVLYLDMLFTTYNDPVMVLAEYNGGPLNSGFLRARSSSVAAETRDYVIKVSAIHELLKAEFEDLAPPPADETYRGLRRAGKSLPVVRPDSATGAVPRLPSRATPDVAAQ